MCILAALCLLLPLQSQHALPVAQPDARVPDLLARSIEIKSIDPADDENLSDLLPLKSLIGDARLVVLGEQSHGDGAVFYAKARVIKFLHQHMGFDVLTWESGMFDCRDVDRALHDLSIKMEDIARMGIFPIWTFSAQVTPTLEYVRSTLTTDKPIETCGFDHQFSGGETGTWPSATIAFFDKADATLLPADLRESVTAGFADMFGRDPAKVEAAMKQWQCLSPLMDQHRAALVAANGEAEFAFMRRCADDAVVSAKSLLEFLASQDTGGPKATDNNTRDKRMAENLAWLVKERYPDRKIIAWMATMHSVHDIQKIQFAGRPDMYKGVINCGTAAREDIGAVTYTIGFTAADGHAGNVWAKAGRPLQSPTKGSLEDLCLQNGKPFLFIDFKGLPVDHWLRQPLVSRPLGYGEMTAIWPEQMDAMLYIQTMFPSTRQNALPPYAVLRAGE